MNLLILLTGLVGLAVATNAATNTVTGRPTGLYVQSNTFPPSTNLAVHPFLYAGEFQHQNGDYFDNQKVYLVRNGKIVSERTPTRSVVGSSEGATINTSRLNLDSSGAFAVASHTADKSNTRFTTASYTLRTDERGNPMWIVTLQSERGRPVGTIYIGANKGNVTRTEGMFAGAQMGDVVDERDQNKGQNDGNIQGRIRGMFQRAQDEARGMFDRTRRSFVDFINRI